MSNTISNNVLVYDLYEYSDKTQTKTFSQKLGDGLLAVKQAPCHVKLLGILGVACGIASTTAYSFLCASGSFVNGTSTNTTAMPMLNNTPASPDGDAGATQFGCIASAVLAGVSALSLSAYTYLTCAGTFQLEDGELEVGVNKELNIMKIKYGEYNEDLNLDAPNFVMQMRRHMVDMCKYAMSTDGEIADVYELIEQVCKYVDQIRECDSCMVFVFKHITEWFEENHYIAFREYQIKSGRPVSKELEEILSIGATALARIKNEPQTVDEDDRVVAEFVFTRDSLVYDDERGTEFTEVPLS